MSTIAKLAAAALAAAALAAPAAAQQAPSSIKGWGTAAAPGNTKSWRLPGSAGVETSKAWATGSGTKWWSQPNPVKIWRAEPNPLITFRAKPNPLITIRAGH